MSKDRPVSGTREWAASNVNIQTGCSHGCKYCYANANAVRFKTVAPGEWGTETLNQGKVDRPYGKRKGTIMYPTTHDITPENIEPSLTVLKKMLASGNDVLIVSKPHSDCIERLCDDLAEWKDQILFRFTIGAGHDEVLRVWEPGAPPFQERMASLAIAYGSGFGTSISMEPLLETDEDCVVILVELFQSFVTDSIWIGKANRVEERLKRNGLWDEEMQAATQALLSSQTDERILSLYERLKGHPKVKWKESIKSVVGIDIPTEAGLDV